MLLSFTSVSQHLFSRLSLFFFFNDTATTEIYTLSLHDALPISSTKSFGSGSYSGCCWQPVDGPFSDCVCARFAGVSPWCSKSARAWHERFTTLWQIGRAHV